MVSFMVGKIIKNIKMSYSYVPYTVRHKRAMMILERQFTGRNTLRIWLHDTNKLVTYILLPFMPQKWHDAIHHRLSKHHWYEDISKLSESVKREIVLDWESAHYTKPDKPMPARPYCYKYHYPMYQYLEKYFDRWKI